VKEYFRQEKFSLFIYLKLLFRPFVFNMGQNVFTGEQPVFFIDIQVVRFDETNE